MIVFINYSLYALNELTLGYAKYFLNQTVKFHKTWEILYSQGPQLSGSSACSFIAITITISSDVIRARLGYLPRAPQKISAGLGKGSKVLDLLSGTTTEEQNHFRRTPSAEISGNNLTITYHTHAADI